MVLHQGLTELNKRLTQNSTGLKSDQLDPTRYACGNVPSPRYPTLQNGCSTTVRPQRPLTPDSKSFGSHATERFGDATENCNRSSTVSTTGRAAPAIDRACRIAKRWQLDRASPIATGIPATATRRNHPERVSRWGRVGKVTRLRVEAELNERLRKSEHSETRPVRALRKLVKLLSAARSKPTRIRWGQRI